MNRLKACDEHPLGILCKCQDYKKIAGNFKLATIGTLGAVDRKKSIKKEPISSAKIHWVKKPIGDRLNFLHPVLEIKQDRNKVILTQFEQRWIPVREDVTSLRYIRPNTSFVNRGGYNTQSSQISTLTDMLPHRGFAVKRRDMNWATGSHSTPVEMTNDSPNFKNVNTCYTDWVEAVTFITGSPPY